MGFPRQWIIQGAGNGARVAVPFTESTRIVIKFVRLSYGGGEYGAPGLVRVWCSGGVNVFVSSGRPLLFSDRGYFYS